MWAFGLGVVSLALAVAISPVQARDLQPKDLQLCKWGADAAQAAQRAKLAGVPVWHAREQVESRKYSQPWMRKMALGINNQTYQSKSRLGPLAVKRAYYDGCIKHELARQ